MLQIDFNYAATAYRAEQAQDLPVKSWLTGCYQKSKTLTKAMPARFISYRHIKEIREFKDEEITEQEYLEQPLRTDGGVLRMATMTGQTGFLSHIFMLTFIAGWGGKYVLLPFFSIISFLFAYLDLNNNQLSGQNLEFGYFDLYLESFWLMHSTLTIPLIIIGLVGDLLNRLWLKTQTIEILSTYELNRQTGMVTLFFDDGTPEASFPFREFVAEMSPVLGHQGVVIKHNVVVRHHQHSYYSFNAEQLGEESTLPNAYALWNFIQCYMDTSQPLPDTPLLEPWRHSDPVTREHDLKTGRDPYYWRKMGRLEIWRKHNEQANLNAAIAKEQA